MAKKRNILITGATGFIGSHLVLRLLNAGENVCALVRDKGDGESIEKRMEEVFCKISKKNLKDFEGFKTVKGDISKPMLGLDKNEVEFLFKNINVVIHSAASTQLKVDEGKEIIKLNVEGTRNILEFSRGCQENGKFERLIYLSTIFVSGDAKSVFSEDMHDVGQQFNNFYEESKFEAERLVRDCIFEGLNTVIVRPSLVAGDSVVGKTTSFKLFYQLLHCFSKGLYKVFPATPSAKLNVINIDRVVDIIFLLFQESVENTYHLISDNNYSIDEFLSLASEVFLFDMPKLVPVQDFDWSQLTPVQKKMCLPFIPYLNRESKFAAYKTFDFLKKRNMEKPHLSKENLKAMFSYCKEIKFIK